MAASPDAAVIASQEATLMGRGLIGRIAAYVKGRSHPQTRLLKKVELLQLGPKRTLYLVECDGSRFLISAAGDRISAPVPLTQRLSMCDAADRKERQR